MGLAEDIKQDSFRNQVSKAIINVYFTSNWLSQKHHELFKSHSMTTPQYNVLRILRGQHPKPATVNLIIDRMLDKSSNASRIVDKLEAKGLVIRKQCAHDRRAVDVFISKRGLSLLDEMDGETQQMEKNVANLSEEEADQLNFLLDKMRS